jgi:tetratricopeptide (TPR) repeat protein
MQKIFFFLLVLISVFSCNQQAAPTAESSKSEVQEDTALVRLNKLIAQDPNNYIHYLERARYFGKIEKFGLAYQDLNRAVAIDSTRSDIYLLRGQLNWIQKNADAAYQNYSACIRHDSANIECLLLKAEIDIALKNFDVAFGLINAALRHDDHVARAYYLKGNIYLLKADTNLAASSYQTAIEVDPSFFDAYVDLGTLYANQKHDLAEEYFNSAITIRPNNIQVWYNKAMFLQESGFKDQNRYSKAFACYDTILKIDPKFFAAFFNKGYINLVYLKHYEDAIKEFSLAIEGYPGYYQAYYNRGLAYEKTGRIADAEHDYRQSLQIQPDYTDAAKALSRIKNQ